MKRSNNCPDFPYKRLIGLWRHMVANVQIILVHIEKNTKLNPFANLRVYHFYANANRDYS